MALAARKRHLARRDLLNFHHDDFWRTCGSLVAVVLCLFAVLGVEVLANPEAVTKSNGGATVDIHDTSAAIIPANTNRSLGPTLTTSKPEESSSGLESNSPGPVSTTTTSVHNSLSPQSGISFDDDPIIIQSLENVTKTAGLGETAKFKCRVKGYSQDTYSIEWEHNGGRLANINRFIQKDNTLRIQKVIFSDRGTYRCKATNKAGKSVYSAPGNLFVEFQVVMTEGPEDRQIKSGTVVNLTCTVLGYPEPHLHWEINGEPYLIFNPLPEYYSKPYLVRNITYSTNITCITSNSPPSLERIHLKKTGHIFVVNPPNVCAVYNKLYESGVCSVFRTGDEVFLNTSVNNGRGGMESLPIWNQVVHFNGRVSKECLLAFHSILCHMAYPDCAKTVTQKKEPLSLCQEDCLVVQNLVCTDEEWSELRRIQSEIFIPLYHISVLPECSALPLASASRSRCTKSNYFKGDARTETTACTDGNGEGYRGRHSSSESGLTCYSWNQKIPQNDYMFPEVFPQLVNASNYCRNPGGLKERPWCYVGKGASKWQYCDIITCDEQWLTTEAGVHMVTVKHKTLVDIERVAPGVSNVHIETSLSTAGLITIIASVSGIVIIFMAILCFSFKKYKYIQKYPPFKFRPGFNIDAVPENPMFGKSFSRSFNPYLSNKEYPRNEIVYLGDIGEGAFGRVFKATARDISSPGNVMTIAVKMLKSSASQQVAENFNREAVMMSEFNDTNIIKMWGVCFVGKPLCLLLEYMEKGDLQEFLHLQDPRFLPLGDQDIVKKGLPLHMQISFARQVASGMSYLAERQLVHRDIATRNCLVNTMLEVKISDFGLARYIGQSDYYLGRKDEKMPVRWTSPEALWHYRFTIKSDVWSYGVLMWEIFSYAEQPYSGLTLEEVFLQTQQGFTLSIPDGTPQGVRDLLTMCWSLQPSLRPSFHTLRSNLWDLESTFLRTSQASSISGDSSKETE